MQETIAAQDTAPDVRGRLVAGWRAMAPARKAALVNAWSADVAALALVGLRRRHPQAGDAEIRFRLGSLLLGEAVAEQLWGPSRSGRS